MAAKLISSRPSTLRRATRWLCTRRQDAHTTRRSIRPATTSTQTVAQGRAALSGYLPTTATAPGLPPWAEASTPLGLMSQASCKHIPPP
ncbi:hypothetical protein IEO21_06236 [Rhodonia placenta]|uniref:Uncharacterized protein n=1 Tax=Rhodonia placenta TaxID=104341 RepID=A0A8H7P0F4_9APHY|nr:hypothetical protein IEO21_06236 [Postia placenta]